MSHTVNAAISEMPEPPAKLRASARADKQTGEADRDSFGKLVNGADAADRDERAGPVKGPAAGADDANGAAQADQAVEKLIDADAATVDVPLGDDSEPVSTPSLAEQADPAVTAPAADDDTTATEGDQGLADAATILRETGTTDAKPAAETAVPVPPAAAAAGATGFAQAGQAGGSVALGEQSAGSALSGDAGARSAALMAEASQPARRQPEGALQPAAPNRPDGPPLAKTANGSSSPAANIQPPLANPLAPAAPAIVATPSAPTQPASAPFAAFLQQASANLQAGSQQLTVRLQPEHLGTMRINMVSVQGQVDVTVEVTTQAARAVLEADLKSLAADIRRDGGQIGEINLRLVPADESAKWESVAERELDLGEHRLEGGRDQADGRSDRAADGDFAAHDDGRMSAGGDGNAPTIRSGIYL